MFVNLTTEDKPSFLEEAFDKTIQYIPINDNVKSIPWDTLKHWMWPSNDNLELAKKYLAYCGYTLVAECSCRRGIKDTKGHHHFITYGYYTAPRDEHNAWRNFLCKEYACTTRTVQNYKPKDSFDRAIPAKCVAHAANMLLYCFKKHGSTTCEHYDPINHYQFGFDPLKITQQSTNYKMIEADPQVMPNSYLWHSISFMKTWGEAHTKNKYLYVGPEWEKSNAKCLCIDQPIYSFKGSKANRHKARFYYEQQHPLTEEQQIRRDEYRERKQRLNYIKNLPIKESLSANNQFNRERNVKIDVDMSWGDSSCMVSKNN